MSAYKMLVGDVRSNIKEIYQSRRFTEFPALIRLSASSTENRIIPRSFYSEPTLFLKYINLDIKPISSLPKSTLFLAERTAFTHKIKNELRQIDPLNVIAVADVITDLLPPTTNTVIAEAFANIDANFKNLLEFDPKEPIRVKPIEAPIAIAEILYDNLNPSYGELKECVAEIDPEEFKKIYLTTATVYYKIRLNSNIYKNFLPEEVYDLEYIESLKTEATFLYSKVVQINHGFQANDVVSYRSDIGYFKPVASPSMDIKNIVGIISAIKDSNTFSIMIGGRLDYPNLSLTDTTTLYLSDKNPGKLVHYEDIDNMVYIPIAIYTNNSIIINILNGTSGIPLVSYNDQNAPEDFERYNSSELQEIINAVVGV